MTDQLKYYHQSMVGHLRKVLNGEYNIPHWEPPKGVKILDIGANCGAYSFWAERVYDKPKITAFEPHPDNCEMFENNCPKVKLIRKAVVAKHTKNLKKLFIGKNNVGEHSLYKGREQTDAFIKVPTIAVSELPKCDILKIDAEGNESKVIGEYIKAHVPTAICLEAHGADERRKIEYMLLKQNLVLVGGYIRNHERSTLVFLAAEHIK